ncbi:hypothetical protein GF371_02050 [Candidatus Woesearchaeota archaeon]|nr:hypothetical protein [Candidatus Woesearchaeota archaeon]
MCRFEPGRIVEGKKEVKEMFDTEPINGLAVREKDRETGYYRKIEEIVCVPDSEEDKVDAFEEQVQDIVDRIEEDLEEAGLGHIAGVCSHCLREAINNANDAHFKDYSIPVAVQYFRKDTCIYFSIIDRGFGFDLEEFRRNRPLQTEDIDGDKESYYAKLIKYIAERREIGKTAGIGLLTIERAMDKMNYENNKLVFIKNIPRTDPDSS